MGKDRQRDKREEREMDKEKEADRERHRVRETDRAIDFAQNKDNQLTKELIPYRLISSNSRHGVSFVSPPSFLRYIKSVTNHFKLCTFMFPLDLLAFSSSVL